MNPFETYTMFISLKNHFTKNNYDYIKYFGRTRATVASFNKRKDKYFFERLSRKKNPEEIKNFYISNFVDCDNPQTIYISDLMKNGENVYIEWLKRIQSLSYMFETEIRVFIQKDNFNDFFLCENGIHSPLIKKYLQKAISLETLVILDKLLNYSDNYNKILNDPVWEFLEMRMKKYSPFLTINKEKYSKILKETICE